MTYSSFILFSFPEEFRAVVRIECWLEKINRSGTEEMEISNLRQAPVPRSNWASYERRKAKGALRVRGRAGRRYGQTASLPPRHGNGPVIDGSGDLLGFKPLMDSSQVAVLQPMVRFGPQIRTSASTQWQAVNK